jgi:hypothetical protein
MLEQIHWTLVADSLPDADITVLMFAPTNDDPVWPGYLDGTEWRYVNGSVASQPIAWAEMPEGPVVETTETQQHTTSES